MSIVIAMRFPGTLCSKAVDWLSLKRIYCGLVWIQACLRIIILVTSWESSFMDDSRFHGLMRLILDRTFCILLNLIADCRFVADVHNWGGWKSDSMHHATSDRIGWQLLKVLIKEFCIPTTQSHTLKLNLQFIVWPTF